MTGSMPGIMSGAIFGSNPWKKDPVVPGAGLVHHYLGAGWSQQVWAMHGIGSFFDLAG
jgi:hypothetical protein